MSIQGVNGGADGFWLTVSDLARRVGVNKAAVSRRVARFELDGLVSTKPAARGAKLVNVAEYDRAVGAFGDQAHAQAPVAVVAPSTQPPPAAPAPDEPQYSREQAREKAYKADLARLDLEERLGKLMTVEMGEAAAVRMAEALIRVLDQMVGRADEIAAAVAKDGEHGVKVVIKGVVRDCREAMTRTLERLAEDGKREHEGRGKAAPDDE